MIEFIIGVVLFIVCIAVSVFAQTGNSNTPFDNMLYKWHKPKK